MGRLGSGICDSLPGAHVTDYVATIPAPDLEGLDIGGRRLERAYVDPPGPWIHLLFTTSDPDTFLDVVVRQVDRTVHGHHLFRFTPADDHR